MTNVSGSGSQDQGRERSGGIAPARPKARSRSPFDDIRHVEDDATEWWSVREMMEPLGYVRWENMENPVRKAKSACRNNGYDVNDHFRDVTKVSGSRGQSQRDVQVSRFGAYLIAMNGDPDKPEIAAAQRYFAVQTYRAETLLPAAAQQPMPTPQHRPWSERMERTIVAHRRHLIQNCPAGSWSIYTATVTDTLILEDEFLHHCLPLKRGDLPDGSIGQRWKRHREEKAWAGIVRNDVPLEMPDIIVYGSPLIVYPAVYGPIEIPHFQAWLFGTYMPEHLPQYLGTKFPKEIFGITPASAADNTCKQITGRPAQLPAGVRQILNSCSGYVPLGRQPLSLSRAQQTLFE